MFGTLKYAEDMKGMENGFMEKLLKVLTYDFSILLVKSEMQKTVDT